MRASGFNPMRWDCGASGCFNVKRRPKIEMFADCFPGRVNFGDVDGLVEMSGIFCLIEWKGEGGTLRRGQEISFSAFTRVIGNIVFVVEGNAETMEVWRYCIFWKGRPREWVGADLSAVKQRIRGWATYARSRREIRLVEGGR